MASHQPETLNVYQDPRQPSEARVADLLQRMTLEEKIGQLIMWNGQEDLSFINTRYPGSILHIWGEKLDRAMDMAAQNRLGIPLLV
ncbi:MAG TPA: beta-glucosidase, partial [Anaerolineae bacterium]|nr:beta-glucosidase [Anaerolineae bacterium]